MQMGNIIDIMPANQEVFYEKFKKDYFPSFDFFRLFFATLALKNIIIINTEKLYNFLRSVKDQNNEFEDLLKDINFYYDGIKEVSKDIEPNINSLQTLGLIGRSNPSYENILNYFGENLSQEVKMQFGQYSKLMDLLTQKFINFPK
jgi:hypothetical protein